tara:strand:+ start:707 stop:931 length:225 start_codon:yes stop_codon:yes gene_type:complete
MSSSRVYNVEVRLGKKTRNFNQLLRKFMKMCKEEGIVREVKDRSFYESKAQKRRRKKHASKMRHKKKRLQVKDK